MFDASAPGGESKGLAMAISSPAPIAIARSNSREGMWACSVNSTHGIFVSCTEFQYTHAKAGVVH